MTPHPLLIRKLTLRKTHLSTLSDGDRNLFFLSGHILNELNSLNKVFAWSLRSGDSSESNIISLAQGAQSMIYARILAGKLWEAWEALSKIRLSSELNQGIHPDSQTARAELKTYFSHSSLIQTVRKSFAFHYSRKLGEQWEEIADGDNLQIVLGGNIGNNIDLAAELITNAAIFRTSHPTDLEAGAQTFLNDVQTMARHFTTFLEGISLFYLKKMLGDNLAEQGHNLEIKVAQKFSEVCIPHFCVPDKVAGA